MKGMTPSCTGTHTAHTLRQVCRQPLTMPPPSPLQEVDLVAELEERGLSRQAAEQLLDAGLALGLSVWVGARPYRWGQRGMGWAGLQHRRACCKSPLRWLRDGL